MTKQSGTHGNFKVMTPTYFYTRFGIGVSDPQWIEYRLRLFQAVTLPSITRHLNDHTKWLIVIDEKMGRQARKQLEDLTSNNNIELLPVVVFPQFARKIESVVENSGNIRLIRVDDDDAISHDFLNKIPDRPGLHTLPSGIEVELAYRIMRPTNLPFLSLNTVYHGSAERAYEYVRMGHHRTKEWAERIGLEVNQIKTNEPMFMYSRHKQSDSNFAAVHKSIRADKHSTPLSLVTRQRFGLDETLFQEWRDFNREAPAKPAGSVWTRAQELHNEASDLVKRLYEINTEVRELNSNIFG